MPAPSLAESIVWAPASFVLWCDITAGLLYRCPIEGPDEKEGVNQLERSVTERSMK